MSCECGCGTQLPDGRHFSRGHHNRKSSTDYIVDENGCWIWQRIMRPDGYGAVYRDGRPRLAYHVYFVEAKGAVPEGLELDHLCRNRACVNPEHLESVPRAVNSRRGAKAKLTWDDVDAIRASSEPHAVLAKRYGVSGPCICNIRNFKRWAVRHPQEMAA